MSNWPQFEVSPFIIEHLEDVSAEGMLYMDAYVIGSPFIGDAQNALNLKN